MVLALKGLSSIYSWYFSRGLSNFSSIDFLNFFIGFELSYVLPSECSDKFEELFTEIEETRQELKISSYGASVTTLEEVFIKVGPEARNENDTHVKLFRQLSGKDNLGYNRENTGKISMAKPGRVCWE